MFSFKNFGSKINARNFRNFTPYLMIAILLTAIIIPVWAESYTEVADFASFKAAATMGGKIRLTADIEDTESGPLELYNNLTIDLNGHTLSKKNIDTNKAYDKNRWFISVRNGTLILENSQAGTKIGTVYACSSELNNTATPRTVGANTNEDGEHAKVIVNDGVRITSNNPAGYENSGGSLALQASTMYETDEHAYDTGQSAEVVVNEGATIIGCKFGVRAWGYNAKLTVNGGDISSLRWGVSIQCGAKGEINGGKSYGRDRGGLCNDLGTTVINGGTFSGTSSDTSNRRSVGNYWDSGDYPGCTAPSKLTINGGTFENSLSVDESENITTTITGGKYKEDPSDFLSEEYYAEIVDGYYVVKPNTPVEIATKAELEAFRDRVNNGATKLNAKLTADINIAGSEENQWIPIGSSTDSYKGIFDGNGHEISGLYINKQSEDGKGLFGYVSGATIRNVTVEGSITGSSYVGGLCGSAYDATITNCTSRGIMIGSNCKVGGICGGATAGTISSCVNNGNITDSGDSVYYIGGICGYACNITITNCINDGSSSGDQDVGGICGFVCSNTTIRNCVNEGSTTGHRVGGICGRAYVYSNESIETITIKNCISTGKAEGSGEGGVVGWCESGLACTINIANCGYVTGGAEEAVGATYGEGVVNITETKEYAESAIPATSALITLDSLMLGDKKPAVTIYPENACNKGSVSYALSSSDTGVATVSGNNVTGTGKGTATISGTISGLLGASSVEVGKEIKVTDGTESTNYRVTADQQGAIPTGTITAKIKILFKDLQEMLVTGVQAVVNYATDVLELVSAQKSSIEGATTPATETAGEVSFGLVSTSGVEFTEGQYYDFGTMTFKVKSGAAVGTLSNLSITGATYTLTDDVQKTATTTATEIEVYQPVTNINITSQTGETTMLVQDTLQLEAEVLPTTAKTRDIQWISGDESIATVDANGLVTAQRITSKTAVVIIRAKALDGSNTTGTIQLNVKRPKVTGMSFAQAAYQLDSDTATKNLYSELSPLPDTALKPATNEITWQSSNANFAISSNGVISLTTPTEEKQTTTVTAQYMNEDSETVTATCTVSSKPKMVNLNLATKLEGRTSGGGTGTNVENVEVYLYDSANNPLWNGSGTTDASGNVSFEIDSSLLTEGQTVKLWIKGERYLAKLLTETVTLSGSDWNVTMSEKLKAADANTDNKVNLTDFGILGNSFLKKKGVTGFDARADFNADDKVNLTDFGLLGNNFLKKGDSKPAAAVTMFMTAAADRGTLTTAMSVLNTETASIAEETLASSTATDEETQEEEILAAVQNATGAELNASTETTASSNSSSTASNSSSSSSSGCNAGYGALALMFAIPLFFKKRK